jgi:hypothetical protein
MRKPTLAIIVLCAIAAAWNAHAYQQKPKVRVLVLSGMNNHAWRKTSPQLRAILEQSGRFDVRINEELLGITSETLAKYDVVLSDYNGPRVGEVFEKALLDFVSGGKGLAIVHAANNAFSGWDAFDRLIGFTWRQGAYHPAFGQYGVTIVDANHPITQGLKDFDTTDEMYCNLRRHPSAQFTLLATSIAPSGAVQGMAQPMALVAEHGQGRVFHTPLGHVMSDEQMVSMRNPGFQALLLRGVEWAATGQVTIALPEELKKG